MSEHFRINRALPKITLVTAVLNGERFLTETLASIRAQRYPNLEYIVCDGGSTDNTAQILEANGDIISRVIRGKDRGMYDALARGFSHATGEILGWIGCDDLLMPWCLSTVAAFMEQKSGRQWVTGIPAIINEESRVVWMAQVVPQYRRAWIRRRLYSPVGFGVIQQECTFFTRKLYEQVGGLAQFSELKNAGDFNLWCRFAEHSELDQIGVMLACYRMHGGNITGDGTNYLKEAKAIRVPCGKCIGYTYSYLMFLWRRFHRTPRMIDPLTHRFNPELMCPLPNQHELRS